MTLPDFRMPGCLIVAGWAAGWLVASGVGAAAETNGQMMTMRRGLDLSAIPAPSMTLDGPYGSPLALAPPNRVDLPNGVVLASPVAPDVASAERATVLDRVTAGVTVRGQPSRGTTDPLSADHDLPPLPGMFSRAPTQIPGAGRDLKSGLVAPHLTPDVDVAVSKQSKIGVFGEVGKVEVDRTGPIPSVKARDLGAGVTFQYRFGQ